jgi:hypothetical protein
MFRPPRPSARIAPSERGRQPPLLPWRLRCPGTLPKYSRIPGSKARRNNRPRPSGRLRLSRCRHSRRLPRGSRLRHLHRLLHIRQPLPRRLHSTHHHNSRRSMRNRRNFRSSPRSNTLHRNRHRSSSTRRRNRRHSMRPRRNHRGSLRSSTRRRNHHRSNTHHRPRRRPCSRPRHPGNSPSPCNPRLLYGSWSWDLRWHFC